MKTCSKCGVEKPLESFSVCSSRKDGLQTSCKACKAAYGKTDAARESDRKRNSSRREYQKEWRKKNRDRIAEREAAYKLENKDRLREYHRRYRQDNLDRIAAYQREYYIRNKSDIRSRQNERNANDPEPNRRRVRDWRNDNREYYLSSLREYHRNNPEKGLESRQRRRARKKSLPSERVTVRQVALRDGAHCWLCGDELSDFDPSHMDHLIPLSAKSELLAVWGIENPGTVVANMALACPPCNIRKSNKVLPCAIARYLRNSEPLEAIA